MADGPDIIVPTPILTNISALDIEEKVNSPHFVWWVIGVALGVGGNVVLGVVFVARPYGKAPLQVDRLVGLLSLTGLLTSIATLPPQIYTNSTALYLSIIDDDSIGGLGAGTGSLCQIQGFLLNLLCLLSLWYTAVLALERYVRLASPHEHALTFSLLNLSVVVWGVLVVLLIEVSGPIYGWAQYGYVPECGVCVLSPASTHILTYTAVHTSCYVATPSLAAVLAALAVIRRSYITPHPHTTPGSQVLKTVGGMRVLCCAILLSVLFMLPYHLMLLLQATEINLNPPAKVISYWLMICAITGVYPAVLLSARPSEVWPAFLSILKGLRKWRRKREEEGGEGENGGMMNRDKTQPLSNSTLLS